MVSEKTLLEDKITLINIRRLLTCCQRVKLNKLCKMGAGI